MGGANDGDEVVRTAGPQQPVRGSLARTYLRNGAHGASSDGRAPPSPESGWEGETRVPGLGNQRAPPSPPTEVS